MRFLPFLLLLLSTPACHTTAQPPVDPKEQLPGWMYELVTGTKPAKPYKPPGAPLHTNAFIGTWSVQMGGGQRIDYWGDAYRMVFRVVEPGRKFEKATLVDLQANVRMDLGWMGNEGGGSVEDLHLPQGSRFHDIWSDTVMTVGRTRTILGEACTELVGVDGNGDSTRFWRTTSHPKLFADLGVWSWWLKGNHLEHLNALSDKNAGGSLRVEWKARRFGPAGGSLEFIAIQEGRQPMPELHVPSGKMRLEEERLAWINNSGTGRLPAWMRERLSTLPPDPLPVAHTPPVVDRDIPDNAFVGTFTAERSTLMIGQKKDTTMRVAKYSYWADARRAVLQLDDPDDEGFITYMVDLDEDVVVAAINEGHSYVIPKVYISTLESVGLPEFGRGVELELTATGKVETVLGHRCELYTANEPFLSHFWFSDVEQNPAFDIARWMEKRTAQDFKELMVFGVADKPMPFAVMGTHVTSFKPGKASPPAVDLSTHIVRDQRLRKPERPHVPNVDLPDANMIRDDAPVPPPPAQEENGTGR